MNPFFGRNLGLEMWHSTIKVYPFLGWLIPVLILVGVIVVLFIIIKRK